jgi:acetoin utilization deacetylase AcuC-like enzyme
MTAAPRVWLLTDAAMDHHVSFGHPERPERREAVAAGVRDAAGDALREADFGQIDNAALRRVHPPEHLDALAAMEARGGGWVDPDTYVAADSLSAARLAAGATLRGAFAVANGEAEVAFAAVRPPGHHASANRAGGFCLVNNIAVAAEALRDAGLAGRVAILDWDVHHGDGTQAIFDAEPDVAYASTHQWHLYPGTGDRRERGRGAGEGTMHNIPLQPGAGDAEFVAAWRDELLPALEEFRPDALLVSAGYDAHVADPLAHLEVTEAGYETVARLVGALSRRLGLPGVSLVLEGGYDLDALRASAAASVRGLLAGRDGG